MLGMSFWSSFACMALEAVMLAYIIAEVVKMYKHRPTQVSAVCTTTYIERTGHVIRRTYT